jgi:hypothetical protein
VGKLDRIGGRWRARACRAHRVLKGAGDPRYRR